MGCERVGLPRGMCRRRARGQRRTSIVRWLHRDAVTWLISCRLHTHSHTHTGATQQGSRIGECRGGEHLTRPQRGCTREGAKAVDMWNPVTWLALGERQESKTNSPHLGRLSVVKQRNTLVCSRFTQTQTFCHELKLLNLTFKRLLTGWGQPCGPRLRGPPLLLDFILATGLSFAVRQALRNGYSKGQKGILELLVYLRIQVI